jgi:hypothetical protein
MKNTLIANVQSVSCCSVLAVVSLTTAAATPQLPESVAACARIDDTVARTTCYDREIAALRGNPAAAPSAAPRPPVASPPEQFGQDSLPKKAESVGDVAPAVLAAKVARLAEQRPGIYTVTLDNGQVWRQTEGRLKFRLAVDDVVSIRKAGMGGYRMWRDADGAKIWVRVVRIR